MYIFEQNLLTDYAANVFGQNPKQSKFRFCEVGALRFAVGQERSGHQINLYPLQIDDDVVGTEALRPSICENVADA